jgi:hypothetical protein
MSNCNVTFWKDKDRKGSYKNYDGAQNVPDLSKVNWTGSKFNDMKDDTGSIDTASATWVRVYSKANYSGRTALIGPNAHVNMDSLFDDDGYKNMDDTIESFQLFDRKPDVDVSRIKNNFKALYRGSNYNALHNLWNNEFYAQDSQYRVYDPTIVLGASDIAFTIKLDHIQAEHDDHAVVNFSMDYFGGFTQAISVSYTMADASQVPDWAIKLIDGAIDEASVAAKAFADGAEIVITDGVGVVATVEVNKVIDETAKALTFCVDHVNAVLGAIFKLQDDGGATYFSGIVSHSIARLVYACYQELYGNDVNTPMGFDESAFLQALGTQNWSSEKDHHNPVVEFSIDSGSYRACSPDNSFLYARGGAVSSVKVDTITSEGKESHLILQASYSPKGELFSVVGCVDIFLFKSIADYVAPTSGVITRDKNGKMIVITKGEQGEQWQFINYPSLEAAYTDLMGAALRSAFIQYQLDLTAQQLGLVNASVQVLSGITAAM